MHSNPLRVEHGKRARIEHKLLGFLVFFCGFVGHVLDVSLPGKWTEFDTATVITVLLTSARGIAQAFDCSIRTVNTTPLQSFTEFGDCWEKV